MNVSGAGGVVGDFKSVDGSTRPSALVLPQISSANVNKLRGYSKLQEESLNAGIIRTFMMRWDQRPTARPDKCQYTSGPSAQRGMNPFADMSTEQYELRACYCQHGC